MTGAKRSIEIMGYEHTIKQRLMIPGIECWAELKSALEKAKTCLNKLKTFNW